MASAWRQGRMWEASVPMPLVVETGGFATWLLLIAGCRLGCIEFAYV